nr:hypothetical protein [Actinomycetota bacterium]
MVRFGPADPGSIPFEDFVLLTTERAAGQAPAFAEAAAASLHVPAGPVPEAAAAVREGVAG